MERAAPLDGDGGGHVAVLERRHRRLEVAPVRHAVGADRPAARQLELLPVVLADEAAGRAFQHLDAVDEPARKDRDLLRLEVDHAELRREPQPPLLGDNEQLRIGREEVLVLHGGGDEVDVACHAGLRVDVAGRGHRPHPGDPGERLGRVRHRIPAILAERDDVLVDERR